MTEVHLVTPALVPDLIRRLEAAQVVAVDTEFHTERHHRPDLFLVQLGLPDGSAWLLDPLVPGLLSDLAPALVSRPAWLVHAGEQDLRLLRDALGDVAAVVHDTQVAGGLVGPHHPMSLAALVRHHLALDLPKSSTLSDWSRRPLDPVQVRYAADDVLVLPALWAALTAAAERLDRRALVDAACAEHRARALAPPDAGEGWRELDTAGVLTPPEAAALIALLRWRDALATTEDRPPRTLIGDAALRQLARGRPATPSAVFDQRRLPRGFVKAHADAIVGAIASATAPGAALPNVVAPGSSVARRLALVRAFTEAVGHAREFAAPLVVPGPIREALARLSSPSRADVAAALGDWRDALAGAELTDALNGRLSLTFSDTDTALSPRAEP
jgi:ribonuclease D